MFSKLYPDNAKIAPFLFQKSQKGPTAISVLEGEGHIYIFGNEKGQRMIIIESLQDGKQITEIVTIKPNFQRTTFTCNFETLLLSNTELLDNTDRCYYRQYVLMVDIQRFINTLKKYPKTFAQEADCISTASKAIFEHDFEDEMAIKPEWLQLLKTLGQGSQDKKRESKSAL